MTTVSGETTEVTHWMGATDEPQLSEQEMLEMIGPCGDDWKNFGRMRTLGLGGVGQIFSATEPGLRRFMAVKVLRSEHRYCRKSVENFIREARVTAQIEHPNIVPVHRIGYSPEAGVYFTMKEIDGRDLRTIICAIREKKPFAERFVPMNRRLEIFIAICQGIAFAHSKGVVHCDLKPANIMVGNFGEVMIMDWGLSIYRNERDLSKKGQRINLSGNFEGMSPEESVRNLPVGAVRVCGTPAFMAPEQASGQDDLIDEKSDIYGLGAILYCLLTLESAPIYPDRSTDDVLFDAARGRIIRPRRRAPLRSIPRELEAIAMKALAFHREDRYASAEELLEDVRHYMENYPVTAYRKNWFYKLKKLMKRRPMVPLALFASAVAGSGVLGVQALEEHSQNQVVWRRGQHCRMQADAYYKLAVRTYRNLQRGNTYVSEQDFLRQSIEFANYANNALECLSLIEQRNGFTKRQKKEFLSEICYLVRKQVEMCHLTGNTAALLPMIRQLQSRWQTYTVDCFAIDPQLVLMARQIARNQSGIILTVPENVSVAIREEDPDRCQPGEWMETGEDFLLNLPSGSYLLRVDYPDDRSVYLPVLAIAGQRVNIDLNSLPQAPDGFVFVHGGTFRPGSSEIQNIGTRYLPGFFMQKDEVSLKDYLQFWRQLKDPAIKQLCRGVYRDSGVRGEYMWDENGVLNPLFSEDMPISGISGFAAEEYCRYRTAQTGMLHRLPTQLEWEKAASGVDGRRFVWGNTAVLNAAYTADFPKNEGKKRFAVASGQFPRDLSVYGVRDMAGNLREMVRNPEDSGSIYRVMGGSCQLGYLQATTSHLGSTNNGVLDAGFRCVIEIPQKADENSL